MKFSERIGKKEIKVNIQKESMDNDLRTSLWNVMSIVYFQHITEWISGSDYHILFNLYVASLF